MIIMSILRMILVIILCIPVGYLFLYLGIKLVDMLNETSKEKKKKAAKAKKKRDELYERRSFYYNGRS